MSNPKPLEVVLLFQLLFTLVVNCSVFLFSRRRTTSRSECCTSLPRNRTSQDLADPVTPHGAAVVGAKRPFFSPSWGSCCWPISSASASSRPNLPISNPPGFTFSSSCTSSSRSYCCLCLSPVGVSFSTTCLLLSPPPAAGRCMVSHSGARGFTTRCSAYSHHSSLLSSARSSMASGRLRDASCHQANA